MTSAVCRRMYFSHERNKLSENDRGGNRTLALALVVIFEH